MVWIYTQGHSHWCIKITLYNTYSSLDLKFSISAELIKPQHQALSLLWQVPQSGFLHWLWQLQKINRLCVIHCYFFPEIAFLLKMVLFLNPSQMKQGKELVCLHCCCVHVTWYYFIPSVFHYYTTGAQSFSEMGRQVPKWKYINIKWKLLTSQLFEASTVVMHLQSWMCKIRINQFNWTS